MLIQRIGHPESTSLKGVEEGTDRGNVSCLFCPKNQADGSKNGQFELRGFSPSSRIVPTPTEEANVHKGPSYLVSVVEFAVQILRRNVDHGNALLGQYLHEGPF